MSDERSHPTGSEGHRTDIEGLRAIAVGAVILYHAGMPFLTGGYVGVDVFFVVSGFLITGLIVREMEERGSVDLARFYARRIRRLLPAGVTALLGTLIVTALVLPETRWASVSGDVAWSALYFVNWRFAARSTNYLEADIAPSPVQHFWSLAVEEQFYFVWPCLLLATTALARRRGLPIRRPLQLGLVAVFVPSLAWSIFLTHTDPSVAYFVTTTRMWELAVGGGLAILAPRLVAMPRARAEVLGWAGLAGIAVASACFGAETLFPGYAALLPVLATAAVIAAGTSATPPSASKLLGWRPLVVAGGMSYALYLWHWPVLAGADAYLGGLSPTTGLAIALLSSIPAWLSHAFVERPLRRSAAIVTPARRGIAFGVALTGLGVAGSLALAAVIPEVRAQNAGGGSSLRTRPALLPPGPIVVQTTAKSIEPDPLNARDDVPAVYADGCHQNVKSAEPIYCAYGALGGPIVALVGDSHAAQWVPPLRRLAAERGFELRTYTKSACPFAAVELTVGTPRRPYLECAGWNENLVEELAHRARPALVITTSAFWPALLDASGERLSPEPAAERLARGFGVRWDQILQANIPLVAIRDVPYPRVDLVECVGTHRERLAECAVDRSRAMAGNTAHLLASERTGVPLVDLTDRICAPTQCPAVVHDLLVWRDKHHLTATYASALARELDDSIEALPRSEAGR